MDSVECLSLEYKLNGIIGLYYSSKLILGHYNLLLWLVIIFESLQEGGEHCDGRLAVFYLC